MKIATVAILIIGSCLSVGLTWGNLMARNDVCKPPGPTNDFFGLCGDGNWWKYFDNQQIYVTGIANFWMKNSTKIIDKLGWQNVLSDHTTQEPFLANTMVTMDLFIDDFCRKRFMCKIKDYIEQHEDEIAEKNVRDFKRASPRYFSGCEDYESKMLKCNPVLRPLYAKFNLEPYRIG